MKISNESKVGILAAVGIALLFIGFNYLKGINVFNKGTDYYVQYSNSAGISVGDPVIIDGLTVGRVKSVELQKDQSGADVIINFEESVNIPDDSYALIRGNSLLAEKYIQVFLGKSTNMISAGGELQGQIETDLASTISQQFKPITDKVNTLLSSMDTAINVLRGIFTEQVQNDFANSMANIKTTLASFNNSADRVNALLEKESDNIESIITDVSGFAQTVNETEDEFVHIVNNLKAISDSLNSVEWQELAIEFERAANNINEISAKINNGEGSVGMLVNDEELYMELTRTLGTLDSVLDAFGKNPTIRLKLFN